LITPVDIDGIGQNWEESNNVCRTALLYVQRVVGGRGGPPRDGRGRRPGNTARNARTERLAGDHFGVPPLLGKGWRPMGTWRASL